jgi:hypothetical protein
LKALKLEPLGESSIKSPQRKLDPLTKKPAREKNHFFASKTPHPIFRETRINVYHKERDDLSIALKNLVTIKKESIFLKGFAQASFLPPPTHFMSPKVNAVVLSNSGHKNKKKTKNNGNKGVELPNIIRKIDFERKESLKIAGRLSDQKKKVEFVYYLGF